MPRAKQPSWKGMPVHQSDDRDTDRHLRSADDLLGDSEPPLSDDVHVALGQIMAAVQANNARTANMVVEFQTLSREVGALARATDEHRKGVDDAAKKAGTTAATHTSNRLAVLMGALVTLYEVASPALHELWKGLGH